MISHSPRRRGKIGMPIEKFFQKEPLYRFIYRGALKRFFNLFPQKGVKIMEEEWDYLIVLDACRYDLFKRYNWIDGKLRKRISLGSRTKEWAEKNFDGEYPNTVYISGNPHISKVKFRHRLGRNPFRHIEEVWDYGWKEEIGGVPPNSITKAAFFSLQEYKDKRMIIHYNSPHYPFIADPKLTKTVSKINPLKPVEAITGGKFLEKLAKIYPDLKRQIYKRRKGDGGNIWDFLREGVINAGKIKTEYKENLKIVLKEVEKLLNELSGRIIITSDHGNLFGEYWLYGHPSGIRFKELIEVPWFIIDYD